MQDDKCFVYLPNDAAINEPHVIQQPFLGIWNADGECLLVITLLE
jgi:hypothetical protein